MILNEKQLLLAKLSEMISNTEDSAKSSEYQSIFENYLSGKYSASEVESRLTESKPYWTDKVLPKSLYDSLKSFSKGNNISESHKAKMISSIITRAIIESEHDSSIDIKDLGVLEFSSMLNEHLSSNRDLDSGKLRELLESYGLVRN